MMSPYSCCIRQLCCLIGPIRIHVNICARSEIEHVLVCKRQCHHDIHTRRYSNVFKCIPYNGVLIMSITQLYTNLYMTK